MVEARLAASPHPDNLSGKIQVGELAAAIEGNPVPSSPAIDDEAGAKQDVTLLDEIAARFDGGLAGPGLGWKRDRQARMKVHKLGLSVYPLISKLPLSAFAVLILV
jgi:hypothetical protein